MGWLGGVRVAGYLFILIVSVLGDDMSINADGSTAGLSVEISNDFNNDIRVMWLDNDGGEIKVMDIAAGSHANMATTAGHRFLFRQLPDGKVISKFTAQHDQKSINVRPNLNDLHLPTKNTISSFSSSKFSSNGERIGIHPLVSFMHARRSTSVGAKFKSLSSRALDIYWEDGANGVPQGLLRPGQETTTNTYEGHVFYFTEANVKSNEIARVYITQNQSTYMIHDIPQFTNKGAVLSLALAEEAYQKEYLAKTGIQYRHYFGPNGPRAPPILYMWPAHHIGQFHVVESSNGFWNCRGSSNVCQSKEKLKLRLEVVSTHPKVFIIEDFFSAFEAEEIIAYAKPRIAKSTVGQGDSGGVRNSDTRTSSNTWMPRSSSDTVNTLYLRAADLLKIDEQLLTSHTNAEDMQVVHYDIGEKYDAHHDWGVSGYPESRYITLLLYLNDMPDADSGGETSFPKANGGTGIKVSPKRGTAVLFYSLLEDGNGDDLSLHQALPPRKGEKWLANFWVWDPKKKPSTLNS